MSSDLRFGIASGLTAIAFNFTFGFVQKSSGEYIQKYIPPGAATIMMSNSMYMIESAVLNFCLGFSASYLIRNFGSRLNL